MFIETVFSKYQCGFQKGYCAQHCLLVMIEKWKRCLDRNTICGALLKELPKPFGRLPHSLLIAKLYAYVFYKNRVVLYRNLAKFTRKHLWQGLYLNKVVGLIK